jgi:RsiW-degrading membrane proteinase PrsW (M82 family)
MLARIRKAVVSGVIAGATGAIAVLAKAGNFDKVTVSQAIGAFVAAGVVGVWTTWRVPNAKALAPYAPK